MNFTKDQIEFIKELLRRQREICENEWAGSYLDCNLLNAPEPELPEAVEESEPYAWVEVDEQIYINSKWHSALAEHKKEELKALYLHPEQPLLPELIKALGWQGGTINQVIEEVVRLKKESIVFPTKDEIIEAMGYIINQMEANNFGVEKHKAYRQGFMRCYKYLKSKIENK